MTMMVQQTIQLACDLCEWKQAHVILFKKKNKRDLTLVKSYKVISLLNCMDKVIEKVVSEQLL